MKIKIAFYTLSLLVLSTSVFAKDNFDRFYNALTVCMAGSNLSISGDTKNAMENIFSGDGFQGEVSTDIETKMFDILKIIPAKDRNEFFSLYTECVSKVINSNTIDGLEGKKPSDKINGLIERSDYFLSKQSYDKAIELAQEALNVAHENELPRVDKFLLISISKLGAAYAAKDDYDKAHSVLSYFERNDIGSVINDVEQNLVYVGGVNLLSRLLLNKVGKLFQNNGNSLGKEAKELIDKSLNLMNNKAGEACTFLLVVGNEGVNLLNPGGFLNSENPALDLMKENRLVIQKECIDLMLNKAVAYLYLGDYQHSLDLSQSAASRYRNSIGVSSKEYNEANSISRIAQFKLSQ